MYMLISVFEREILTEQFNTFKEARARMMDELKEEVHDKDLWRKVVNKMACCDDEDFGFYNEGFGCGPDYAWSNSKCNCDWKIVKIK